MNRTRLIELGDAPILAGLVRASREFLAPWEPVRPEDYFTTDGQRRAIAQALQRHQQGTARPHVILDDDGTVAGRIALNGIVRGTFQSCNVSYWVSASRSGRGLATAGLADMIRVAFDELVLHRIQAETLLDNQRSQRVLEHNGFARIGLAPAYLKIAGRWQDHILYQLLNPAMGQPGGSARAAG